MGFDRTNCCYYLHTRPGNSLYLALPGVSAAMKLGECILLFRVALLENASVCLPLNWLAQGMYSGLMLHTSIYRVILLYSQCWDKFFSVQRNSQSMFRSRDLNSRCS